MTVGVYSPCSDSYDTVSSHQYLARVYTCRWYSLPLRQKGSALLPERFARLEEEVRWEDCAGDTREAEGRKQGLRCSILLSCSVRQDPALTCHLLQIDNQDLLNCYYAHPQNEDSPQVWTLRGGISVDRFGSSTPNIPWEP